jgi:hypothetical protein
MGIKNYFPLLKNIIPNLCLKPEKGSYDHIHLELNYVLHFQFFYKGVQNNLKNDIIKTIKEFEPTSTLDLCKFMKH